MEKLLRMYPAHQPWPIRLKGLWDANTAEMPILIAIGRDRSLKVQGDLDKTMGVKGAEL